jgi:CubicO group peptidase (beta-lactamase class C family)
MVVSFSLRADPVDDTVAALMAKRHIPGLSLAIIQDGKIAELSFQPE